MIRKLLLFLILGFVSTSTIAQNNSKKALDFDVYDIWKRISTKGISDYSDFIYYEVLPGKGDGQLIWRMGADKRSAERGYKPKLSFKDSMFVFLVKPGHDTIRELKLAKTKEDNLPKDSLAIFLVKSDSILKIPRVSSYKIPSDSSNWMAYQLEKPLDKKDATDEADKKKKKKKKRSKDKDAKKEPKIKEDGTELVITHPLSGFAKSFAKINEYTHSKNGESFGFIRNYKVDKADSTVVSVFDTYEKSNSSILKAAGTAKSMVFDEEGRQCAFLFSRDTVDKNKEYKLYYWKQNFEVAVMLVDSNTAGMPSGWTVSEHSDLKFSRNGNRLFLGTNEIPIKMDKDTLLEEEKVKVDVWSWQDLKIQPQQLHELEREQKRNYQAVYHLNTKRFVQLADKKVENLRTGDYGNAQFAMGTTSLPYQRTSSWQYPYGADLYLVNTISGVRKRVAKRVTNRYYFSPKGSFILWYNDVNKSWNSYDCSTESVSSIAKGSIVSFVNERHNTPNEASVYGVVGWTENDEEVLIYDRFDIWMMDPAGEIGAVNITNGRSDKNKFRLLKLDKEINHVKKEKQLLRVFNENSKKSGYAMVDLASNSKADIRYIDDVYVGTPLKSKYAGKLLWTKGDYNNYPDLYLSSNSFKDAKKVSNVNPQIKEYKWGSGELVSWNSIDNRKLEGLLYKPENFDATKSYPMIVYFYERYSDLLNFHFSPRPSRSTVSFPFYVSNEYVVFVPNIEYGTGQPGKDAYNAIVSGTNYILSKHKNIDANRLGIQGQSWGGYQTAHVITQTEMFAAAMAGAPVSNMTSAYGGIRWGSGMSRMFQYERSQSRIGSTLWERTDLYIENSPLFFSPAVKTPLLIMHNDNDGAVPWYQGIELFVALRRLDKPVWMLNYNKEEHNLTKWPNRVDLSIRMKQFFDHYLMNKPMPEWMKDGIPAIEKGRNQGYDLTE